MSRGCFSESESLPKESLGQIPLQCNVEVKGDTTGILTLSPRAVRASADDWFAVQELLCLFFLSFLKNQIISGFRGCFFFHLVIMP